MSSKTALFLGFIIGIAAGVGGLLLSRNPPRQPAVRALPVDVAVAEMAAASEKKSRGASWWGMDAPTPAIPPAGDFTGGVTAVTVTNPVNGMTQIQTNKSPHWEDWRNMTPEERDRRFQSFWSNQMTAARANFISNAVLTEAEATRFDVLTTAMNLRLKERLDPVVEKYQAGWRPTSEERTRLTMDVGAILVNTYDEMDRNMPEDWRDATTNGSFSLTQFIEPQYMPFVRGFSSWSGRGPGAAQGGAAPSGPPPVPPR